MANLASTTRFAGSEGESKARARCRALLEEGGFVVDEQPFEYSQLPGRWGPSGVALLAAAIVWGSVNLATRHQSPWCGLVLDVVGLATLSLTAYWLTRYGVPGLNAGRSRSSNLVATHPGAETRPRIWLTAHIDSKSQTIPMLLRVTSAIMFATMSAGATVCIVGLCIVGLSRAPDMIAGAASSSVSAATAFSWLAVVAALPIVFCFVGNKSRGALDNATGVAAVILAAEQLVRMQNIGIVLTSAEELGLGGARYFAATESHAEIAINCDTIDDTGAFLCMASGARIKRLDEAVDRAVGRLGISVRGIPGRGRRGSLRLRPMIPGILADNVAFTDAGWESFTLSRGNIGTLAYVHTSRDVPDRIQGTGIAKAASFIAAIVQELG